MIWFSTLPETNIAPETLRLEDEFLFETGAMLVPWRITAKLLKNLNPRISCCQFKITLPWYVDES